MVKLLLLKNSSKKENILLDLWTFESSDFILDSLLGQCPQDILLLNM